jgi:hypothetical protein
MRVMARTTTKNIPNDGNGVIGFPITFSQFVKNPLMSIMFIGMLSLFYLVYDMKTRIGEQEEKIESLELEVRNASKIIAELKESNGLLKAELQTRKELNNIR